MQVDWLTVSAQMVNFLILIVLLKKFLYRPILRSMELRRQGIADQLRDAEAMQQNAERSAEEYRIKRQQLEDQRSSMLDDAKREIENQRTRMFEQLREEVNQKRLTWYADFAEEKNSAREDIKALLGDKIMRLSRRALSDLAGADLERQLIQRFLEQLGQLPEAERQQMLNALTKEGSVKVLTHSDVSAEDATKIQEGLLHLHPGLSIDFNKTADIICGIVLETEGFSWSWTFDRYLEEFEELFADQETPEKSKGLS